MEAVISNLRVLLPFFLLSWAVFILMTIWKPQRLRNSFFLLIALFFTVFFITGLFGDYMGNALLIGFLLCCFSLLLVPVMLIINGITMIKKESFSFANILSLLLGIGIGIGELALIGGVGFAVGFSETDPWAMVFTFLGTTVFYFSVWMLSFVLYMLSISWIPHRMKFQYVIIHGCGLIDGNRVSKLLANRLDTAIRIYERCKVKPILIPSGGRGSDEKLSEAEAMTNYLLAHGIPAEAIAPEDKSATTLENLRFSKALIDKRGGAKRIALVSSNYHVYRCLLYAKKLRFPCVGFGAKVAWYYWPSATIREFVAVFSKAPHVFWMLGGYALMIFLPFFAVFREMIH